MKGFKDSNNKFHPITTYKGVRKSDRKKKEPFPVTKTEGIPRGKLIQMQREAGVRGKKDESQMMMMPIDISVREQMEWENAVGSDIVKVKHEMMDGRPITSVRFENGEEWFEFDSVDHQEDFLEENNIKVDEELVGEFVEVNHSEISGYITMPSGKVAFGEKEDTRMKRQPTNEKLIDKLKNKKGVSAKVERLEEDDDEGTAFVDRVVVNITKEKTLDLIGNGATAKEIAMRATGLTEDELDQTMMTNGLGKLEKEGKIKYKNGKWVKVNGS